MDQPSADAPSMFQPIAAQRAFEVVCDRIRELVASGRLKKGDKLPPERELALQLGVSRLAIREAFRSLENAGLIALQRGPKGGAYIQSSSDRKMTELMQDMLNLGSIRLSELTEARIFILDSVARLACERATAEDLAKIAESVKLNEIALESGSREVRLRHATEFYELLTAAAKNKVMTFVVRSLSDVIKVILQRIEIYPTQDLSLSRRRFLEALQARDGDRAAQEMHAHLRKLHEHIVKHAVEQEQSPDLTLP